LNEDGASGRHQRRHPFQGRLAERGVPALHLVEVFQLDEQTGIGAAEQFHHSPRVVNDRSSTPSAASRSRTVWAMATAPGLSPCTQIESAWTSIIVPSMALMGSPWASRRQRSAISSGSCSTAPGSRRGTRVPSEVYARSAKASRKT